MLPVRLCDSTLTLVVPSGPLLVADKHNWSREVTYGPLDCSWSHEISSSRLGRSQQSLLDCWAIAGFHGEPWAIAGLLLGTWAIAGLLLGTWAIAESLLDCCLVAPFAPWSPPMLRGRPLCSVVAPYAVWSPLMLSGHHLCCLCLRNTYEGCTLPPRVSHACHVITRVFLGITFAPQVYYAAKFG